MDKKTAFRNIILLLDDLADLRKRITENEIPEIEVDLLRQQLMSLYGELNRYSRLPATEMGTTASAQKIATPSSNTATDSAKIKDPEHDMHPRETSEALHTLESKAGEFLAAGKKEKLIHASEPGSAAKTPVSETSEQAKVNPVVAPPAEAKKSISDIYAQARSKNIPEPAEPKGIKSDKASSATINQKMQSQQGSLNERFAQQNVKTKLADKLKLSRISDLNKALSINQRVALVKNLFHNDDKEFRKVITFVNSMRNFSEAKFYLQSEIAKKYQWDEENPYAQELMELVYRKFL